MPTDAADAGARTEIVLAARRGTEVSAAGGLTEAGALGRAANVLVAGGGATGDADVAYRESAAVPSPASNTHSSAMPARRSVREPANRPGFFDESGVRRVMAHDRWRGARAGPARQCLRASSGGPRMRLPLWPCSPSHARIVLMRSPLSGGAASAKPVRTHQRSCLRRPTPRILRVRTQHTHADLKRNVRAGDVRRMRILWRVGGRGLFAVRWNGLHAVRDRCCDARTSLKTVRPERSAEGAKSKGRESRKYVCFDFAELRSATLNTNGF